MKMTLNKNTQYNKVSFVKIQINLDTAQLHANLVWRYNKMCNLIQLNESSEVYYDVIIIYSYHFISSNWLSELSYHQNDCTIRNSIRELLQ